jgi:hypothetical protein
MMREKRCGGEERVGEAFLVGFLRRERERESVCVCVCVTSVVLLCRSKQRVLVFFFLALALAVADKYLQLPHCRFCFVLVPHSLSIYLG